MNAHTSQATFSRAEADSALLPALIGEATGLAAEALVLRRVVENLTGAALIEEGRARFVIGEYEAAEVAARSLSDRFERLYERVDEWEVGVEQPIAFRSMNVAACARALWRMLHIDARTGDPIEGRDLNAMSLVAVDLAERARALSDRLSRPRAYSRAH